jgi:hypothetical protein
VHSFHALPLKKIVTNTQHLVDEQNIRVDVSRDGKPEPSKHSRRIPFYRRIDKLFESLKIDDSIEALLDFVSCHSQNRAIKINIFSTGQILVKPSANLD